MGYDSRDIDDGVVDTSGGYDCDCGVGERKVGFRYNSKGGGVGDSNDDPSVNDDRGVNTNSDNDRDCAHGKSKALCIEGTAGDDASNDDGGPNDDGGVDTNDDGGGEGYGNNNVGDKNDGDDSDKYDNDGDDTVDCSIDKGRDNADNKGKDGKDEDGKGDKYGENHDNDHNDNENDDYYLKSKFLQFNFARISTIFDAILHFWIQLDVGNLYKKTRY